MKHPPSGEVEWLANFKINVGNRRRDITIKAKTWFEARAKATLALQASELSEVIVELK